MAEGFATEIDLSKLDTMITNIEKNLQRFVDKSKDAQSQVIDAFNKMGTQGVNKFIGQLSNAINQVMEIGKKGSAITWNSQNLERYVDQVNQLIRLVQQVQGAGYTLPTDNLNKQFASISKLKDDLKMVNELLNKGEKTGVDSNGNAIYRQLTKDEQNYFVELKKNIQEQLKLQNQSIQERLNSVRKALHQELKETQDTEKKKTQARNQTYKGSIKYSDNAKTLEQERQAIKNLEVARERLKKTDSDYAVKLEELNNRINAHRINVEAATKTEAQRNALTSSTRAEYARLLTEQDKLRQSYERLKASQATLGTTPENTAALQNIVKRYRDVYGEILKYKQSANGQLDATERKHLADQAAMFAENEKRKTDIAQQEAAKRATISSTDANKVIANASGAKNVNQQLAAIQQLKEARDKLDKTDRDYDKTLKKLNDEIRKHQNEIDKTRGKNENLNKSHRNLMDTAGQLQRKLALVFSVSAIQGYMNKLIQIRGEFEKQQRSLQVLLQNKDEADKLWQQTIDLAVKSPFRVKELVTYTRQLAAYRIETEKLHDTTRRLSDVSAGLGVDMQRLILAFGQVRAANYLRGTELRQFTEAGIPLLDELAKYFTEMEGRAVSAGDVFERISKRMVAFSDVEEVFHRMTNAGGAFYKMQEELSSTLSGMISNMHDQIDLMLNDIGKANDGVLKGTISFVSQLVKNWRELEPYIKTAGYTFLLYFGLNQLRKIAKGFTMLWGAIASNPITATIGILGALAIAIYQVATAQSKLNKVMQEVDTDVTKDLEKSISLYHELSETINDATKSNQERNKALEDLKSKFKDILPDQLLELEYVKGLGDNYRDVENAMMDYYNAKAKAQKRDRIESMYGEEIEGTDIPELQKSYARYVEDWLDEGKITQEQYVKLKAGLNGAIVKAIESVKSGEINASAETLQREIEKNLQVFTGMNYLPVTAHWTGTYKEDLKDVVSTLKEYRSAIDGIDGLPYETYDQKVAADMINAEKENIETATNAFKQAASLYEKYVTAIPKIGKDVATQRKEIEEDVQKILKDLPSSMSSYSEYLKNAFGKLKENADKGAFAYKAAIQTIESELFAQRDSKGNITSGLAKIAFDNIKLNEKANDAAIQMVDNFQETLNDKAKGLEMTDFQDALVESATKVAQRFGLSVDVFQKFVPTAKDSLSSVRTALDAEITNIETRIKEFETSLTVGWAVLSEQALNETKANLDELQKQLPALKLWRTFLGKEEKGKDGGKGRSNSLYDERIKVIDDMNKKYKELNKTLSQSEALQGAFEAYIDSFATAYEGISWVPANVREMSPQEFATKVLNFPNENDLVRFLDKLSKEPMKTFEKIKVELAKGEYVYDMKVRAKVEEDKALIDQIEEMFSGYELSLELQKLNIPPDLAKQLFNLDTLKLEELRPEALKKFGLGDMVDMTDQQILNSEVFKGMSQDAQKEVKKTLEKIDEMENKAQLERLKKYSKYLVQAQSERVKIKVDEIQQLQEIEDTFKLNENVGTSDTIGMTSEEWKAYDKLVKSGKQVNRENLKEINLRDELIDKILEYNDQMRVSAKIAKEGVRKETQEQMDKAVWEDFKGSAMYEQLFSDLEHLGTKSIDMLLNKLRNMKEALKSLPPEVYKEIQSQISKLEELQIERTPFAKFKEYFNEVEKLNKTTETFTNEQGKSVTLIGEDAIAYRLQLAEAEAEKHRKNIELYEQIKKANGDINKLKAAGIELTDEQNKLLGDTKKLDELIAKEQGDEKNAKDTAESLGLDLEKYKKARKATEGIESKTKAWGEAIIGVLDGIDAVLDAFGVAEDDSARLWIESAKNIANMIMQTILLTVALKAMGVAANSALGVIGWIATALQAVAMIFASIFAAGDKHKERQIERELALVKKLERSYEDLQRAVDKGYSIDFYRTSANRIDALKQQQEAYERMIQAEHAKKNTDEDRISEWLDTIHELNNEIEDAYDELRTELVGDFKDYSDQLADAMIDALKKGEDGIEAWGQKVDEIIEDIVTKLLVTKFLEPKIAELVDQYYSDIMPKTSEAEKKRAEYENLYNDYLENQEILNTEGVYSSKGWKAIAEMQRIKKDLEKAQKEYEEALKASEREIPTIDKDATDAFEQGLKDAGVWFQQMLPDWFTNQLQQGELSGLQRGIQGITEETAQILEAYMASVRFYVADSNSKLTMIANQIVGSEETANPMLSELRTQTELVRGISTLLNSMTTSYPNGGRGWKVVL